MPLMSGEVILLYLSRNLSLSSHQKIILSVANVITTISYSRMAECEVKQIRPFTSSTTLEMRHNENYYLQRVGGKAVEKMTKGAAEAHCANR